ncbi:erg26, C-3 sterol dehydrogenase [Agyrium rufum]|nr:erg26, C-3 sterol dehydrogenase [Agyrium rufum]
MVISRNPDKNRIGGVMYRAVDIADEHAAPVVFEEFHPRVVFHTAAPNPFAQGPKDPIYQIINVDGTKNLLACASAAPTAKIFVYTSSASVIDLKSFLNADESTQVLTASSKKNPYSKTKAITETLVLQANNPHGGNDTDLRTVSIRPSGIYGEDDTGIVGNALSMLRQGRTGVQLGSNTSPFDWTYVESAVSAHILATRVLLSQIGNNSASVEGPKIDGEAFFVTDDEPIPLWDFLRKVWTTAGWDGSREKVRIISTQVALWLAVVFEWIYWIGTFGGLPQSFNKRKVELACFPRTFDITKAKTRLGYVPLVSPDEGIRRAVEFALQTEHAHDSAKKQK